ncbi:MAG: STAS domain-containing protein [Lachnospiraceae bacterium]|nr:STAS domain-containing protein [Lachnospiraceae bacterium]
MALETTETYQEDTLVIELNGRLDAMTSEGFQKLLLEKINETKGDLILDCSGLEFVSSAGLRTFLTTQKALSARGSQLRLVHAGDAIMKVLAMTGFDKFLKVE